MMDNVFCSVRFFYFFNTSGPATQMFNLRRRIRIVIRQVFDVAPFENGTTKNVSKMLEVENVSEWNYSCGRSWNSMRNYFLDENSKDWQMCWFGTKGGIMGTRSVIVPRYIILTWFEKTRLRTVNNWKLHVNLNTDITHELIGYTRNNPSVSLFYMQQNWTYWNPISTKQWYSLCRYEGYLDLIKRRLITSDEK